MRRTALFLTAAALVVGAANLSAQAPNFSGTWTPVVDPNAAAPQGRGGGGGGPMTIIQDDKTLTITRTTQNGETKAVYNLDGSDSKNSMMGRGGAATDVISKAKWDGPKLSITTTRDMGGTAVTSTAVYWLDASGNLAVSTTQPGRNGGEPTTTTRSYKKG